MADWIITLNDKIIKSFSISEGQKITIGRGKECDVTIDNTAISRQHVSLSYNGSIYFVSDLGSTNGTFVNGKKISLDEPTSEQDSIFFGKFNLVHTSDQDHAERVAASVSTDLMDMEDETIFINKAQSAPQKKQFKPRNSDPRLIVLKGPGSPKELSLTGSSSIKIGKDSTCDIIVSGWFVAPAQCYIIKREAEYCIVPQKSWAGTFVNNNKIKTECTLRKGDIIKIKNTTIRFD